MKPFYLIPIFVSILLTDCSVSQSTGPLHATETRIDLGRGNYKVIRTVRASAVGTVFFGLGDNGSLYNRAHADLVGQAELEGRPRALINLGSEIATTGAWPVIYVKTLNLWATVIEITPDPRPAPVPEP